MRKPRAASSSGVQNATLSPRFWDRFVDDAWGRRPAVFRGALKAPVITPRALFDVLREATSLARTRSPIGLIRFYGDGHNSQILEDFAHWLPRDDERAFASYCRRLKRELGRQEWGIVLNAVHRYCPDLWREARGMVAELFARSGFPGGGVSVSSFIGPYRTTPFAVHKDSEHVFTVPVSGEKVFHLWPYEALAGVLGVGQRLRFEEGHTPFRNDLPAGLEPIELRGGPGDLMYWPPQYWHVARGDGDFNASVTIGIETTRSAIKHFYRWSGGLPVQHSVDVPTSRGAATAHARQALRIAQRFAERLRSPGFRAEVEDESWRLISAHGFNPPIDPVAVTDLRLDDTVTADARFPILTRRRDDTLLCFVNGYALSMSFSTAVQRMIRRLNAGGTFRVGALCEGCRRGAAKDGFVPESDEVVGLLARFVSLHALQLATARRSS